MRTLCALLLALPLLAVPAAEAAEDASWGLAAGVQDGDFGVQIRKDFWLGGDISQITGQASVHFPSKTTFRLDADYHFVLNAEKPSRFYPLAGLQFAFNSSKAKLGVNAGIGVNFRLTERFEAFGEAKYVFWAWEGWGFHGGIYF